VDVGEKKSLLKAVRPKDDGQENHFRPHYFPDIPVDEFSDSNRCASKADNFRRINFENINSVCFDSSSDGDINEVVEEKSKLTLAEIEQQAYQEGFCEGKKSEIESAAQQVAPVLTSLRQVILQLQNLRKEIYLEIEKEVVELALAIARKVICHEVKINKEIILEVIKAALSRVDESGNIKIKLNPSDLKLVKATKNHNANLFQNIERVTFEATESISSGGCIIETSLGNIDARIEKQFRVVEEIFQGKLMK